MLGGCGEFCVESEYFEGGVDDECVVDVGELGNGVELFGDEFIESDVVEYVFGVFWCEVFID